MSVVAHCTICLSHLAVDKFRILPCGHGFCTTCLNQLFKSQDRPTCPHCRIKIRRGDLQNLHLEFFNSNVAFSENVIEKINQMDKNSKLISVKTAADKLTRAAKHVRDNDDLATNLLQAIRDFKDRVIPLFSEVESQRQEITALRDSLKRTRREKDESESRTKNSLRLEKEVVELRKTLTESERTTEDTLLLAEQAKEETLQLREHVASANRTVTELGQHKKRLEDQLDRHTNAAHAQKMKYRALKNDNADLKRKLEIKDKELASMAQTHDSHFSEYESAQEYPDTQPRSPLKSLTRSKLLTHAQLRQENAVHYEFEAMPLPGFLSSNRPGSGNVLKRKNPSSAHGRANPQFPISLDRKGHPTIAIQTGPKTTLRI